MKTLQFLAWMRDLGIAIHIEAGHLKVRAEKGVLTDDIKVQLKDRKAEIIALLSEMDQAVDAAADAIQPAPPGSDRPLSFAQERLWFVEQMDPGSRVFIMPMALTLIGHLNIDALERAISRIIERHEILRTAFVAAADRPTQQVRPAQAWSLKQLDLCDHEAPDATRNSAVQDLMDAPLPLDRPPLLTGLLVTETNDRHLLVLRTHHIVADDWSIGIFTAELAHYYNAFVRNETLDLPKPPIQYADYAYWQRERLAGEVGRAQSAFWRKTLAGMETLAYPTDHPRPKRQTFAGDSTRFALSPTIAADLKKLADETGTSLYMVLLAAFQTLLHRCTGQADIPVGSSTGRRERHELEGLIGMFVNLLVMRGDLSGNPSFDELLARTKKRVLAAFANQDLPFEQVVDACTERRDPSRHPLVQVQLVLTSAAGDALQLEGLRIERSEAALGKVARVDFTLSFNQSERGLEGGIEYNTDLFTHDHMERLGDSLKSLLTAVAANRSPRLSQLPLMNPAAYAALANLHNETTRPFPNASLTAVFSETVQRFPDATALTWQDGTLTYAMLDAAANAVAHALQARGVGPEDLVGICLQAGPAVIWALLGVLKLGAAYVPLAADDPKTRLAFILRDTAMAGLIAGETELDKLPAFELSFLDPLILDATIPAGKSEAEPTLPQIDGDSSAYVVYTSGTTGEPKGVRVSHANVMRLVYDTRYLKIEPGERLAQASNIAFDALTFEVFTALLHGANLCLVAKSALLNPDKIGALLAAGYCDTLFITTALFNQLARYDAAMFNRLKRLLFGGEQVDAERVRQVLAAGGPQHLLHVYGPTEGTTFSSWFEIEDVPLNATNIPIGLPLLNTRIYLTDHYLNLSPQHLPGELCIGGEGLARGYLNRPALTAVRFVPNPFEGGGQRLYKSGDVVRRSANGAILFEGRVDHQVKLRGFRIELPEIETTLLRHPRILEAVVVIDDGSAGEKRLIAYVTTKGIEIDELRQFLKETLPDYMLPTGFVFMDAIPLTANGKLDRAALPDPDTAISERATYTAPTSEREKVMAEVWAEVLKTARVGVHDNFFELGGDSLLSIQIKATAKQRGLDFELHQLFENPTIAGLAACLKESGDSLEPITTPAFALLSESERAKLPTGVEDAYPLSYLQMGLLFHGAVEAGEYQVVLMFHLDLVFEPALIQQALAACMARHPILRTAFHLHGYARPLQLVHEAAPLTPTIIDPRGLQKPETLLKSWANDEKYHAFNWEQAPLMRVFLFPAKSGGFDMGISFHHAIMDGWSDAALFTEFLQRYTALLEDKRFELPMMRSGYRDFVALEQAALTGETSRTFWNDFLADFTRVKPPVSWPDHSEKAEDFVPIKLSSNLAAGLNRLAKRVNVPLKTVLLTAHLRVMAQLHGTADIVTGLMTNGRPETLDGERILGLFVNTLPFRARLERGSWLDLIQAVFKAETAMLPHRHFPLPELVRDHGMLFETAMNYTHFHVYRQLEGKDLEHRVQATESLGGTNFTVVVNFNTNPVTTALEASVSHATARFSGAQARLLAGWLENLLKTMTEQPETLHHHWDCLTEAERRTILAVNETTHAWGAFQAIPHQIAATAQGCPNASALCFDSAYLTHGMLDQQANVLAHDLAARGVGPETVVAVMMNRSLALPITLLAILKTGGCYVPLEPTLPPARLAFLLQDSGAQVLVTEAGLVDHLPDSRADLVLIDQAGKPDSQTPPFEAEILPENMAYLIYTSGSTGLPKPVANTHAALHNMLRWTVETLSLKADDRLLQKTPYSFDVSVWEFFLPPLTGAMMVIAEPGRHGDPFYLEELIYRHGVTTLHFVPSMLRAYWEAGRELPKRTLRRLYSGGEALGPDLAVRFTANHQARLYNIYGLAETAVDVIRHHCETVKGQIPIGKPAMNTAVHIADPWLNPAPLGVAGELLIAGIPLARGYQGRPALTAERFIPLPTAMGDGIGARAYRSGDLACRLADGAIHFIGRLDHQVKIRGQRVEPDEVAVQLRALPMVADAAVIANTAPNGETRLTAYLETIGEVNPSTLKTHLAKQFPDYMIPSGWVFMDRLPRTTGGKIDRTALPKAEGQTELERAPYRAPNTATEVGLTALWGELLGYEPVGVDDHFFEMGGHSLTATRLITAVRGRFQVSLSIKALFENPTPGGLARLVEAARGTGQIPPIEAVPRGSATPLSFAQQRLWYIDQMAGPNPVYNLPMAPRLRGRLSVRALARAMNQILARHESLRTVFRVEGEEPVQVIRDEVQLVVPVIDLSGLARDTRETKARELARLASIAPFDLARDLMLRARLLRIDEHEHVLLTAMHHIASDGWSTGILTREFAAFYAAASSGESADIPPLSVQYADFAHWQRQWLSGEVLTAHLDYWRERLAGITAVHGLPLDGVRKTGPARGGSHDRPLSETLSRELVRLSQIQGATLFMTLQAAFALLLARYSRETDIVIGTPIANRTMAEVEPLIGFFANTLVLRTRLDASKNKGGPRFSELLAAVARDALDAYTYQHLPFEMLVDALQPARDLHYNPIFQISFTLQNKTHDSFQLPGLNLHFETTGEVQTKFELTLNVVEGETGLVTHWIYNRRLFNPATISGMADHFEELLQGISSDPQARVFTIPLWDENARREHLRRLTQLGEPIPGDVCTWVEGWAARTPDSLAVIAGQKRLSYAELNAWADHLANRLQGLGIVRGDIVALYVTRSAEMLAALLAVLKAGGAYLPLATAQPSARLNLMLEPCRLLLTDPGLPLQDLKAKETLVLDEAVFCDNHTAFKRPAVQPIDIAYLIYTSGSSGTPKAVAVSRGSLANHATQASNHFEVKNLAGGVVSTDLAFDATVTSLYPPLVLGKPLVFADHGEEVAFLADFLQTVDADYLFKVTPTHMHAVDLLLGERRLADRGHLLVIAGETLEVSLCDKLRKRLPHARLFNEYGPTEATVGSTAHEFNDAKDRHSGVVPIGGSLAGTRLFVCDAQGELLPPGLPGELYLGGPGLALGYLNQAAMTAARFVPNPFATDAMDNRLYRTGDLVRMLPESQLLMFLGRLDSQIKLRGYRMELGEIEAALHQNPLVARAAVSLVRPKCEDPQLVAFVQPVSHEADAGFADQVLRDLAAQLPAYMLPERIIAMAELPNTTSGKIDRVRLMQHIPEPTVAPALGPATSWSQRIAAICASVLRRPTVGVHDNFFELGGHSLLAIRLISRLRDNLGIEVNLRSFLQHPTPATLAEHYPEPHAGAVLIAGPKPAPREPGENRFPLTWSQERLWFLERLQPSGVYNMPSPIRLSGPLDVPLLEAAFSQVRGRHESLRTRFEEQDGRPLQVIEPARALNLVMVDLSGLEPETVENQAQIITARDAVQPFDLMGRGAFRVTLLRLEPHKHGLLITLHHIVSDGWSSNILMADLGMAYTRPISGADLYVPPPAIQPADVALWQRSEQGALNQQMAYWRDQLNNASQWLDLPIDKTRPRIATHSGEVLGFNLAAHVGGALKRLCQNHEVTPYMAMLAVYGLLLQRYSGQAEVNVGTPVANRDRTELEGMIGFLVNNLVMRLSLDQGRFSDLLAATRKTVLDAFANRDVPFAALVAELAPNRDMARPPLFQTVFSLDDTGDMSDIEPFALPGLEIAPMVHTHRVAKFELTLHMAWLADGLHGSFEYNTDLFEASTIGRMGAHFSNLLERVVDQPEVKLSALSMFDERERRQLLYGWNPVEDAALVSRPVHALFHDQAKTTPSAIALIDGEKTWTYAALSERVLRWTAFLRGRGVGAETAVAVDLPMGADAVTAMLAIFMAGGVYVPLDPDAPPARLNYILADAQPVAVLTTSERTNRLKKTNCINIEDLSSQRTKPQTETCNLQLATCYLIYTSGSTGRPKGVRVAHTGLPNMVQAQIRTFGVKREDRVLQYAPLTFDASVSECLMALLSGAALCLPPRDRPVGGALVGFIDEHRISVITLTPSLLATLADKRPQSLRVLIVAGEAAPVGMLAAWSSHCQVFNAYGPTEATVCTTIAPWSDVSPVGDLGSPIPHSAVYLLDENMQPVPLGAAGELYLAGPGLARGYHQMPVLTATAFVPHPFTFIAGQRLYRSGDLARRLPNGALLFHGRRDTQLKILGARVEPGEVAALLRGLPQVTDAAVIARADNSGLIAFISLMGELSETEAITHLAKHLPRYMLPTRLNVLDAIPRTAHGKLDTTALRALDETRDSYSEPVGKAESILCRIWSELLARDRIGASDDFFRMGGHSLLAGQAMSRIREAFRVDAPLKSLFEYPTPRAMAAFLADLSGESHLENIVPLTAGTHAPLSFSQERLWFMDRLTPGGSAFSLPGAYRLRGQLDTQVLRRALAAVIDRHAVLRTHVAMHQGQPIQAIAGASTIPMNVYDLSCIPRSDSELNTRIKTEAGRPFDLLHGPLLRLHLFRLAECDYVLLLNQHHLITDGWSLGVMLREILTLYGAFIHNAADPLPPLPIQYADFAHWQRRHMAGERLEAELTFWRGRLQDAPAHIDLPTDYIRPAAQSFAGGTHGFTIPPKLAAAMADLARETGATTFMAMTAVWSIVLARYAGQRDLCIGTPVANRNRRELEPLIGFFVNNLVLRLTLPADDEAVDFKAWLAQVRDRCLEAYAHQEVPFEQVVEHLRPRRDMSRTPLFQVLCSMENATAQHVGDLVTATGLELEPHAFANTVAKYELSLYLTEGPHGMFGEFNYNSDLFSQATIARAADHYLHVLSTICEGDTRHVSRLPLIDAVERRQLLCDWNQTQAAVSFEQGIHGLFEAMVHARGEAIALAWRDNNGLDQALSYAALNRRADHLADRLQEAGVGTDQLVGVCLTGGSTAVIAFLAILKTGGAYVPLDAGYPTERLAVMLRETALAVLIADDETLDRLPAYELGFLQIIQLDEIEPAGETTSVMRPRVIPEQAAYLMFTSGSTGVPKGVLVTHRNVIRLVCKADYATLSADLRVLQAASIAFDAATFEIWGALLNGAKLVAAPAGQIDVLPGLLVDQQIDVLWLTAQLFAYMVDHQLEALAKVGQLLAGGDALSPGHVARYLAAFPNNRLINGYGPTEGTTFACCMDLRQIAPTGESPQAIIPIGAAITNTTAYVFTRELEPAPVGVRGALLIGGEGLARGYLNQPAATAERFIPHPEKAGERLYQTGDIARRLPNGSIAFHGRDDRQVKLRGFRVEPGEIERCLEAHPAVVEARVLVKPGDGGDKRLVAYARENSPGAAQGLHAFLAERLPSYLVPAAIVTLAAFPLNANGKLDVAALPEPDALETERPYQPPRTTTEQLLAAIWCELLPITRVGLDDDFFELGGHSLLATRVLSRVREDFQVELTLKTLFEQPTLAALADAVDRTRRAAGDVVEPPIEPVAREPYRDKHGNPRMPLSFAQERLWFLDRLEPGNAAYNIPIALRLEGRLDVAAFNACLNELVRRHESLRTHFALERRADGEVPVQVILPPAPLKTAVIDFSLLPEAARENACFDALTRQIGRAFDLSVGPLFKVTRFRMGPRLNVILLKMHHIVSDGWSLNLLFREIAVLYRAFTREMPSPLPEPAIQYADFACWQREWLSGEALDRQRDYWLSRLGDLPAPLDLPLDFPRPHVRGYRGENVRRQLDRETAARIAELCRSRNVTPFMAMLAVYAVLLGRYSGRRDFTIGTPIANRNRAKVEQLIGFFVNTLVLRMDLSAAGGLDFNTLLARIRRDALDAYANQDIPFERIVEQVQPERDMSRAPLAQVLFSLDTLGLNERAGEIALPGLTLGRQAFGDHICKADLDMNLSENGDGMVISLSYNTDLFREETALRMIGHYVRLAEALSAQPDKPLSQIEMLDADERETLCRVWNNTHKDWPGEPLVTRLFEAQVLRTPDATALVDAHHTLSYSGLNRQANRVAHLLAERDVPVGARIGLCLPRGVERAVCLLGILKAGAVYVPMPIDYPEARLTHIMTDAELTALITRDAYLAHLDAFELNYLDAMVLEDLARELAGMPADNPRPALYGQSPAYLIYTSGTTGQPRGVAVPHHGPANLALSQIHHFQIQAHERVQQLASPGFDAAISELLMAWLAGAALVCHPEDGPLVGADLTRQLTRQAISVATITPALLAERPGLAGLKTLIVAGEAAPPNLLRGLAGERSVFNAYGPTEVSVCATFQACDTNDPTPPIGLPIHNTRVHILDEDLNLVPVGVSGALCIAGVGLAWGYHKQPVGTAVAFVPDPFSDQPGERLYRSGDLARRRTDGRFDFLGREDGQIKLRGYRVEAAEIENLLRGLVSIKQAAVVLRNGPSCEKLLVAYLVPNHSDGEPEIVSIREYLKARLPQYMVPSAFVVVEGIPVTSNGKRDLEALPAPNLSDLGAAPVYQEPASETEKTIAAIWREVLGHEKIGRAANFFELGGHSLLGTRVVTRLGEHFGAEIPIKLLFTHPVLSELAQRLDQEAHGVKQAPPIKPLPRPAVGDFEAPLSFQQERLWFLDRLEPGNSAYNMPSALRVSGPLDVHTFERSLNLLTARHESLRTRFSQRDGQALQIIEPARPLFCQVVDLHGLHVDEMEDRVKALIAHACSLPFDLERGPLLRVHLFRVCPDTTYVLLNMHHIISDGWSLRLFARELFSLYDALLADHPTPLPRPTLQYADFAHWQREWLRGQVLEEMLAFWEDRLGDAPRALTLPTDYPRPRVMTYQGDDYRFAVDPAISERLDQLCERRGITPFMALLSVYAVLLARYAGQDDISIAAPIANRNHRVLEPLIGFFVNSLIFRVDLANQPMRQLPDFNELLERVRQTALDAYQHQDVQFEQIVERLQPVRDMSRPPLAQVLFTLDTLSEKTEHQPDHHLTLAGLEPDFKPAKAELYLSLARHRDRYDACINYNTSLFRAETITRLARHFHNLLAALIAEPTLQPARVPMLDSNERRKLLVDWARIENVDVPCQSLHQGFALQAARTPHANALSMFGRHLSYGLLNQMADRLAARLSALGAGVEQVIAIRVERSFETAAAILAVLKSGAAYLPIDPSLPAARVAFMLADTGARLLLSETDAEEHLPPDLIFVPLKRALTDAVAQPIKPLSIQPENNAYIIYTSGSTGQPKGVQINHHQVLRLFAATKGDFGFDQRDTWTLFHRYSFDFSVWEYWGALLYGGRLIVVSQNETIEPQALLAAMQRERVSVLCQTPSAFLRLPPLMTARPADALRLVIFGGEALDPKQLVSWFRLRGDRKPRLVNMYGITETTVHVTYRPLSAADCQAAFGSVIGRAIADLGVRLLDRHGMPCPIGVPGQICVAGAGLARGYLNRPQLTAERFVPDPYAEKPGSRLYLSGDLARLTSTGELVYIGRMDFQVKLRGFRLELGEIEDQLTRHPAVEQAVVLLREDTPGDQRLIAHIVAADGEAPDSGQLRRHLQQRLPDYMLPAGFVVGERLPLTPNGKIDRAALLNLPLGEYLDATLTQAEPRNDIERRLTQVWAQVLAVASIGIHDNFFERGGHSLLAVQLMAAIAAEFKINLPVAALFQHPSVAQLAPLLSAADSSGPLVRLNDAAENGAAPWFIVHPVGGQVHWYLPLARMMDAPCYGLQSPALGGDFAPIADVSQLAETYIHAIRELSPNGPYRIAGWSAGASIAFEIARKLSEVGLTVDQLVLIDGAYLGARHESLDDLVLLRAFTAELTGLPPRVVAGLTRRLGKIPPEDRCQALFQKLAEHRGQMSIDVVDARYFANLFAVYRANAKAVQQYQPPGAYPHPVTLIKARQSRGGLGGLVQAMTRDKSLGWQRFCRQPITVHERDGDHYSILAAERVGGLARLMTAEPIHQEIPKHDVILN